MVTYPIIGTDTSSYEGLIDMKKNLAAGTSFIIPRAGYANVIDRQFANTWANAKGLMPRGTYWYLNVWYSIRQQAEMFAKCLSVDPGEIEPYADFEQAPQFSVKPWPSTKKRGWNCLGASELFGFVTYFRAAIIGYYGLWPWKKDMGIYTGYSYWHTHGSTSSMWANHPLWISEPDPVDEPSPLMPWSTWRFWQTQFAADGPKFGTNPLIAKGIDLNCYNGNRTQFNAELGITPPDPTPLMTVTITPNDVGRRNKKGETMNAHNPNPLSLRNAPRVAPETFILIMSANTQIVGTEIVTTTDGSKWLKTTSPQIGYCASWLLVYDTVPPVGDLPVIHVHQLYSASGYPDLIIDEDWTPDA